MQVLVQDQSKQIQRDYWKCWGQVLCLVWCDIIFGWGCRNRTIKYVKVYYYQKHCQSNKINQQMSTTFKIIQNHIQNSKTSPKKSVALSSSHLSPSSRGNIDSDDGNSSFQKEQVLQLQIKQLQRQNKFLKKKIVELTAELNGDMQQPKKKVISGKGVMKEDIDPTHVTIDFFFREINNLMNSLADLFRVQFTNQELRQYSSRFSVQGDQSCAANKKYVMYKKFTLSRKLQKITLEPEQKRYPLLLEIFTSYYKAKQDCDKFIKQTVDELSERVLQLNKMILNHASRKKNSMRGSCIKSQYTLQDSADKNLLPLPWSLKPVLNSQTLSFTGQHSNIKKKIDMH